MIKPLIKPLIPVFAAAVLVAGAAPAQAQFSGLSSAEALAGTSNLVQKTGRRARRNRRIAAGVALGVLGAVAATHYYQSQQYQRERRYWRHQRRCQRWLRWCRNGSDRSCWRYDTRC